MIKFRGFKVSELGPFREICEIYTPRKIPAIRYYTHNEHLQIAGLHDLQNIEIEFSSTAVTVTAVYFKHSTARGAIIRILYVMDDGSVDYTKSPIIVLDRSTPPGYVLPFKLYAGSYLVFAHDIESDGTLQDGVGFPAVTREFTAGGNSSGKQVNF